MGKTTLLRAISKRELYIPSHVTVLHVEQEVVGDDTLATDSVLEADTVRFDFIFSICDHTLKGVVFFCFETNFNVSLLI